MKTKPKYKNNNIAIISFILSLICVLGLIINHYSVGISSSENLLLFAVATAGIFLSPVAIILSIVSLVISKLYVKKYIIVSITAIILSTICTGYVVMRINDSLSDCGWCSELNTTVQMNWDIQ